MQRYELNLPLLNGMFLTDGLQLVSDKGNLSFEGDFAAASYEAMAAGIVSYLPKEQVYVFPLFTQVDKTRAYIFSVYESMGGPVNPLVKPRHWAKNRMLSRLTSADAALILATTAIQNDPAWENKGPDERVNHMLGKMQNAGFNRYMIATADGLKSSDGGQLDDDGDEEEIVNNQRLHVLFYDHSVVHLTPQGAFLPMGLSNRRETMATNPEALKTATIFVQSWVGVTEMGIHQL